MNHLGHTLILVRRELAAYVHAPIAYIVGVLFLVLQGLSFWAVVSVLADPAQPAPMGAVLHSHFGGTFVYWTVLVVVVALISMRLVAEERRQGTWESLLTTPVAEGAVITGKWLGGVAFYAALWLPTLVYPVILELFAPPGAHIDPGPVAAAYLGALACGASFLAVGVAASAATANQIIAAVTTFALTMLLVLAGQIAEIAPRWLDEHALVAAVLAHIDVRGHMDELARGAVSSAVLVFHASVAVVALLVATTLAVWGRRRRGELGSRVLAMLLVALIAVAANILAARHPFRWDATRARTNSLEPRTEELLRAAGAAAAEGQAVEIVVVRAGLDLFAEVQEQVDRLIARMVQAQPAVRVRRLDPALEPDRLEAVAAELAVPADHLAEGGVVVVQRGDRRRAVDLLDMAGFAQDALGAGALAQFRAEEAIATALAEILDPDRPLVCATTGHGELPLGLPEGAEESAGADGNGAGGAERRDVGGASWAGVARAIERDGARLAVVDMVAADSLAPCRVVILAGPTQPLSASEALAVAEFLARGGRLLLALPEAREAAVDAAGASAWRTGLELVLAEYGVSTPAAVVVDPAAAVETPVQWFTTSGYGEHPITASFAGRRLTLWLRPRAVLVTEPREAAASATKPGEAAASATEARAAGSTTEQPVAIRSATVLVRSSERGWGETDLAGLLARGQVQPDGGDLPGPVPVAVAVADGRTGARIVVLGGAYGFADSVSVGARHAGQGTANERLAAMAVAWLRGATRALDIGAKTPEQVRLIMSQAQRRSVLVVCVILVPGLWAGLGALIWWWRRRA